MDTSDSNIIFDHNGVSDYYHNFQKNILPQWHTDERGALALTKIAECIRKEGKGKSHDCIIGMSGGIDSSYVTMLAHQYGLRPLIFHVDAGWNTLQSIHNIERIIDSLNLDLHTEVINWQEMKDLQLSFLKAGVPDCDIPQDLAYFASLYTFAAARGFKYILTGANYSTECIREPIEWGAYYATDLRYIKDIHSRFGAAPLKTFPMVDIFTYKIYYRLFKKVRIVAPLNFVPYKKQEAVSLLMEKFDWKPYAHKHHESRFTRFFECCWLPQKFGFDKRRAHFSSLILTGQMTREQALEKIALPEIDEKTMAGDFEYVAKKLDLSEDGLRHIFEGENKTFRDYKNKLRLISAGTRTMQRLGLEKRIFR